MQKVGRSTTSRHRANWSTSTPPSSSNPRKPRSSRSGSCTRSGTTAAAEAPICERKLHEPRTAAEAPEPDREVGAGREERRAPEADPYEEHEACEHGAGERAERVEPVEAPQAAVQIGLLAPGRVAPQEHQE